ncbi:MAG: hypothetical protein HPY44_15030 [Armatimonadetes bacterium]|nr:hypothetical protein [Armatimonadota bacterium]
MAYDERERIERAYGRIAAVQALPAAVGIHLGMAIVCFSAVYTGWQSTIVTMPQWAVMLLVGVGLIYCGLRRGAATAVRCHVRMLLALGGLMAFQLCYEPQLANIPRFGEELPEVFTSTYPSIAIVGATVMLVSWLLYVGGGGQLPLGVIPLRNSVGIAVSLVAGIALFCYFMLHGPHDLFFAEALRPMLRAAQAGIIAGVLLSVGGGPGIHRIPHLYIGLTLVLAFLRNLAFPMQ